MRNIIRGTWSTALPTIAVDQCGYGTVLKISTYADPTFYLPDEIEDYMTIKIKKAVLHLRIVGAAHNAGFYTGQRVFIPVAFQERPGDTVPTSSADALSNGTSVEEYLNSKIAGDGPRGFSVGASKIQKETIQPHINTGQYYWNYEVNFRIDLTKVMQRTLANYEAAPSSTSDNDLYLLMYASSDHTTSIEPPVDSNRFLLEVEWDFVPLSRQVGNTIGSGQALVPAGIRTNRAKIFPTRWYQWLFPWL